MDDYAFMIFGLLELYETTFETDYLEKALDFNQILLDHYWDNVNGGFFFTADDGETLLIRKKEIYDGAIPSGNSISMLNLLRLGDLLPTLISKRRRLQSVEHFIQCFSAAGCVCPADGRFRLSHRAVT